LELSLLELKTSAKLTESQAGFGFGADAVAALHG
jgi:hypothetical protein